MTQHAIPCLFMRAGTSRGPFFDAADLPTDRAARDRTLLAALGVDVGGRQIDGLGGGDSLTNKVAIVARSVRPGVDVDYTFAQVHAVRGVVDTGPSCGNMLAGVGPFAIETGMVPAAESETVVRIFDVNTGARIEATVQTPNGAVAYAGDVAIDGAPGTAAPVALAYAGVEGAKTGALLPTGRRREEIDGVDVSCVDAATPMLLIDARDIGLDGGETPAEIDARAGLSARIEAMRIEAGRRMGLGDVSGQVIPKVALLSPPAAGGTVRSRYLTPWRAHAAHAVTGAICVAAAAAIPGTVAADVAATHAGGPTDIEHPAGKIAIALETAPGADAPSIRRAAVVRTARLLMRGVVMAPEPASTSAIRAAA